MSSLDFDKVTYSTANFLFFGVFVFVVLARSVLLKVNVYDVNGISKKSVLLSDFS